MSFSGHEQVFIVQNQLVSGISNCSMSYNTQTKPLYIAGLGYVDNFISGPTEGQVEVSRYMLGEDFVKDIADEDRVQGGIIFDSGRSVGFTRGRLLNYRVSCNVGEIPTINNTFKVYGNLGGGVSPFALWNGSSAYAQDSLVSVKRTATDGFADDLVYQSNKPISAPAAGSINTAPDASPDWDEVSMLDAKDVLANASKINERNYIIPTQGSIDISFKGSIYKDTKNTLSEFAGANPILGFNYSRGLDLDSLYALREEADSGTPITDYEALDVQIIYPIKTTFDFTVSMDNYKLSDMRAFLYYANWVNGRIEQDVVVEMKDPQTGTVLMEYSIKKAKLLSEGVTSPSQQEATLNVSFEGVETEEFSPFFGEYRNTSTDGIIYRAQYLQLPTADPGDGTDWRGNYVEVYKEDSSKYIELSDLPEYKHAQVETRRS